MKHKSRRRKEEREPVRIITQEWVENNCTNVTPRDMEMLRLLQRFPLMNSEHLMLLTPGTHEQQPFFQLSQGQKRCNERIRILYDLHIVNKWTPRLPIGEGTSKQYVALDRAGCKLLNIERRVRNEIPQDWRHQSLILDVYCLLVQGERRGLWEIKFLDTEPRQLSSSLVPDVAVVFRNARKGAALFIEVDRSEKKESVEKQKLQYYREWQLDQSWWAEPWTKSLPKLFFPTVIYAFDETKKGWRRRASALSNKASALSLRSEFIGLSELESYLKGLLT